MVRPKTAPKKQKRGVDFKKYKRKIGRKLPPPKNYTDTSIKSKVIVLPEQSVATEREGFAVNNKGLTLRELLQQTSHHNSKIRKAALTGIKDLLLKHKSELKLHKFAVIEKIRERISDDDKIVRETLYQLMENVIFPSLKEDITGPIISLLMAYIFNAMTHMAIDVRLMAFKFFSLVVQIFPSSFILYAEKVLDNYIDIIRNNQIYLQDQAKFKNVLDGLIRCMSSLASRKEENLSSTEPSGVELRRLHAFETVRCNEDSGIIAIMQKLDDLIPILVNCFRESTALLRGAPVFDEKSFDCLLKTIQCIHLAVKVSVYECHLPSSSFGHISTSPFIGPNRRSTIFTHLSKLWELFPIGKMHSSTEKENATYLTLDVRIAEIFLHLIEWIDDRSLPIEKFLEFIISLFESLYHQQVGGHSSVKVLMEKHLCLVVPFIPRLLSQIAGEWRTHLLEAFTGAYKHCKADSKLFLAYLPAIEEMLLPVKSNSPMSITFSYPDMLHYQLAWIQHLPNMLMHLGDKRPSTSKVVLKLILRIGQWSQQNSPIALEYDNLQLSLNDFYSDGGPFMKLSRDCQELAICSLYYISSLSSDFLRALTGCCLCNDMELFMLLRIIEVLHSAYKAGHAQISDHIGFLVTLVAHKVFPESDGKASKRGTYRSLSAAVCSCLSQMGDSSLVLKLLCKKVFSEMLRKLPLDNMYGQLRMIVSLDTRPTKLSEENISYLSNGLFVYMIEAASHIPEQIVMANHSDQISIFRYYMQPCIFLFNGSNRLLFHVLKLFDSSTMEDNLPALKNILKPFDMVHKVCAILIFMHNDPRLHTSLSLHKEAIGCILRNVLSLLNSSQHSLTLDEKHKIQTLFDQLKSRACKLQCSEASNFERV